jgi:biotin carboxyl carrier protein
VAVRDNQQLRQGDLLFEIDPADFQAQVDIAVAQVQNDEAILKQQEQNLQRQTQLYRTLVTAVQDFQNAQDSFAAAQAQLASARANLHVARLNLSYTKVFAPVDGYVTNMNTSEGTYVTAGVQLIALVDTSSFWIAGYFKETQLPHLQVGQKAILTVMGHAHRSGVDDSTACGRVRSQGDHASDWHNRRGPRWHLAGQRLHFYAGYLPLCLFLGHGFCRLQVRPSRARQVPYAYFLLGLTALMVATVGVTDPARAWEIGLDRTEEILLGVISSLLVTTLLWPRYAQEEFFESGRAALKTVSQLVSVQAQAYTDHATARNGTEKIQDTFFRELSALRNLQQAGARESTVFSVRLSNYNSFLVSLTSLFDAGLDLSSVSRSHLAPRPDAATTRIAIGRHLRRVQHFERPAVSRRRVEFQSHE